jgi:hypothetical protein
VMYSSFSHSPIPPSLLIAQYALIHSKISFPKSLRSHPLVPRFYPHSE